MKKTRVVSLPEAVGPKQMACEGQGGVCTRDLSMTEQEYMTGVALGRKKYGVDNAWNEPEFVRDMRKWEPHMNVRQVARGNRVTVMVGEWRGRRSKGKGERVRTERGIVTRYRYG